MHNSSEGELNDAGSSCYGDSTLQGSSIHSDVPIPSGEKHDVVSLAAEYVNLILDRDRPEDESCSTKVHNCRLWHRDHQLRTEAWLESSRPTPMQGCFSAGETDDDVEIERQKIRKTSPAGLEELRGHELWDRLHRIQADKEASLLVGAGTDLTDSKWQIEAMVYESVHDNGTIMIGEYILVPEHPQHAKISWVSCITRRCSEHLADKMRYKWFPKRFGDIPLNTPYLVEDVGILMPTYRNGRGYAIFEASSVSN